MKKLWFKRKSYGWGWYPSSYEGWFVTIVYILLVVIYSFTIEENASMNEISFTFFLPILILTMIFLIITYKKGEKPRWQWGKKK